MGLKRITLRTEHDSIYSELKNADASIAADVDNIRRSFTDHVSWDAKDHEYFANVLGIHDSSLYGNDTVGYAELTHAPQMSRAANSSFQTIGNLEGADVVGSRITCDNTTIYPRVNGLYLVIASLRVVSGPSRFGVGWTTTDTQEPDSYNRTIVNSQQAANNYTITAVGIRRYTSGNLLRISHFNSNVNSAISAIRLQCFLLVDFGARRI